MCRFIERRKGQHSRCCRVPVQSGMVKPGPLIVLRIRSYGRVSLRYGPEMRREIARIQQRQEHNGRKPRAKQQCVALSPKMPLLRHRPHLVYRMIAQQFWLLTLIYRNPPFSLRSRTRDLCRQRKLYPPRLNPRWELQSSILWSASRFFSAAWE